MKPEYPVAVGGLFLIKMLSDYVDTKATRRYPLDTAVSLKKGDFNTPSVFLFLKKKTAALIVMSKPPLGSLYFVWAHENPTASTTVFLFPFGRSVVYRFKFSLK